MSLTEDYLLSVATQRLLAVRPDLAAGRDLSSPAALRAVREELGRTEDPEGGTAAVCVVGAFRLADWVREVCAFALSLTPEEARAWRAGFTRTLFLAGRPDNLRERFDFGHVAADASVAWTRPAPAAGTRTLRRLLKTFAADGPVRVGPLVRVELPAAPGPQPRPPVHRDLYVAAAGLTVTATLVQVHHLLAEAVLDGILAPGDELTIRQLPLLTGLPFPLAAVRVDTAAPDAPGLRAYAALSEAV